MKASPFPRFVLAIFTAFAATAQTTDADPVTVPEITLPATTSADQSKIEDVAAAVTNPAVTTSAGKIPVELTALDPAIIAAVIAALNPGATGNGSLSLQAGPVKLAQPLLLQTGAVVVQSLTQILQAVTGALNNSLAPLAASR